MKIRILPSAIEDLEAGKDFYEMQAPDLGDYFQDCLFSDIDSLVLYAGIHRVVFTACCQSGFPTLFITGSMGVKWR